MELFELKSSDAVMPRRAYKYDCGFDLYLPFPVTFRCRRDYEEQGCTLLHRNLVIPTGVTITLDTRVRFCFEQLPHRSYVGLVLPRSSVSKMGVHCHLGVIDAGYTGTIHVCLTNLGNKPAHVPFYNSIAQLCIMPASVALTGVDRNLHSFGSSNPAPIQI